MRITLAIGLTLLIFHAAASAQTKPASTAWFGLALPSGSNTSPAVHVGPRLPRPVALPGGESPAAEFSAAALKADVQTIVQFARESRATKEIGNGQMWGRIAGFPSSDKTVAWAADQFRQAGIKDVRIQPIAQNASSALWLPLSWQVTLLGDPAFGAGSADIVLESALPVGPSDIPGGSMTAPLIYVGTASPAVLNHIDVKGKIAVQLIVPQGHMLFERGAVDARSEALMKRGAAACSTSSGCQATSCRVISATVATRVSTSADATAGSWRPCSIAPCRRACRTRCACRSISRPRRSAA